MNGPICLHELFEIQADAHPEREAIICGEEAWSYRQVDQRTNQIARYLRTHKVGPGALVALYFERSERPIFSVLGVLKSGAGYIPLDPSYPPERIKHILADAKVEVVLTEADLADNIRPLLDGQVLVLDELDQEIAAASSGRLTREETGVTPADLSYILFTSGTTGQPKGIMTEHHNVVQFALSFNEALRLNENDRVYQGFSLGFDGSVEEMWMAFSNGIPLVIATPDVLRLGNEAAALMNRQRVTVFSTVPTFLGMITEELTSIRLIIVSGEPCPPALVEKWAHSGRRMLNVYGPTEATVNSTVEVCVPGKAITIGKTLRGYDAFILDPQMQPVPPGESGELYIGGVGVARGYLNQPELSAKHFLANPFAPEGSGARLYRTGDLVRLNDEGELLFLGRIDRQVKIRGFRIELSEIEAVLREQPQVAAAVVNVHEHEDLKELAAYIVAAQPDEPLDRDALFEALHGQLPPYMIPSYLDLLDELPTTASGKVDRKRLPVPVEHFIRIKREIVAPASDNETKLQAVWQEVFAISPISVNDDFFADLGGYSLLAAQVVSRLRNEHNIEIPIRDMYRLTTIRQLATQLDQQAIDRPKSTEDTPKRRTSKEVFDSVPRFTRYSVYALQLLSLLVFYGLGSSLFLLILYLFLQTIWAKISVVTFVVSLLAIGVLTLPVLLGLSIGLKWLIIGKYKPGEYPVWGFYYFRWWLASRVQALSGVLALSGTPVMSLYYRLMGAKVGKNCILDTPLCAIFDLVSIGDDTSICTGTQLLGYRVEDGLLKIGSISIGSRCFVGTHSTFGLNTVMGDDCLLDDVSYLPDHTVMADGEARRGSPALPADVSVPQVSDEEANQRRPLWYGVLFFFAMEIVPALMFLTVIPGLLLAIALYWLGGIPLLLFSAYLMIPINFVMFCLMVVVVKKLVLPQVKPGTYSVESWFFLRKWLVDVLLGISRTYTHNLYTTIYLPPWLRLLGAKIGKLAEISTVTQMTPDLTIIGDGSFFADGSMIGGRRFFRGHVRFDFNKIGSRSFVGNNALLPIGAELKDNSLLGVLSVPPGGVGSSPDASTEWLGSPSFRLPHRQKVEGFSVTETFEPTTRLYVLRYLIDGLRILLPGLLGMTSSIFMLVFLVFGLIYLPFWVVFALTPFVGFALAILTAMSVVLFKVVVMGKFEPVIKPLWHVYIWLNEALNGAYETIAAPLMSPLLGTPFFNWYLRALGCKVGKHVFMGTTLFSEFDLVSIGDYAALNQGVVVQNHLFEDRIMKSDYLRIGDQCSVGNMTVVLYDTEMKEGSSIAPLSLLMKGETLPPFSRWEGIPTQRID